MNWINEVEKFLCIHKDFFILLFTLALVFVGVSSAIIARLSLRSVRRQLLFQEWVFLNNILYNSQRDLFNSKATVEDMKGKSRIAINQWITTLELMINKTQSRINQIENQLNMSHNSSIRNSNVSKS